MADPDVDRKICLEHFLKLRGIVGTGGQAKYMIQGGEVKVNGTVETRRRRKLVAGDSVSIGTQIWRVEEAEVSGPPTREG
jgi:ribosome-associated protein